MDEGLNFSDIFDDSVPAEVKPPEMLTPMEEDDFPTQAKSKFKGLWETELLTETHLQDLFHATGISAVLGMIQDDAVKLAFAGGTQADEFYNKGYPFFLSTMRQKYGNYARDIGGKYVGNKYSAVVHLDGSALAAAGYKHFPIDYWSHGPEYSEQEERIVSNKDKISPLRKFVKDIHIYVPKDLNHSFTIDKLHQISDLAPDRKVKVYFYPHNALAYFRAQRTEKAVRYVDDILPPAQFSPEDLEHLEWKKRTDSREKVSYLKSMMRIYNGDFSQTDTFPDSNVLRWLQYYPHDAYASLMSAAHGERYDHPEIFRDIAKAMKKEGIKSFKDFITLLIKREDDKWRKEQNIKEINEIREIMCEAQDVIPPGEELDKNRSMSWDRADSIFIVYDNGLAVAMQELPTKMIFFSNSDEVENALNIPDFQKFITTSPLDREYQLTHTHLNLLVKSAVSRAKVIPPESINYRGDVAGRVWKFDNGQIVGFWQGPGDVKARWKPLQFIFDKLKVDWKNAAYTFYDKILDKYSFNDIMSGINIGNINKQEMELRKLLHINPQIKKGLINMAPDRLSDYADKMHIPLIKIKQMLGSMDETAIR